jgi:uncharacterized protein YqeY
VPKRQELSDALKESMKNKDMVAVSTIRLILAALKDRDVAARTAGNSQGVSTDEILAMLQTMLKQRAESISIYKKNNREDLAEREEAEVKIIRRFLPEPLEGDALDKAIDTLIEKTGAQSIKDMGKVMGALKTDYAGRVDMTSAGALVRSKLG